MDPELVEQARNGDHDAFEVLAAGIVDRLDSIRIEAAVPTQPPVPAANP